MKEASASRFVKHVPCDKCGSSNNGSLYDDGHIWCETCPPEQAYTPPPNTVKRERTRMSHGNFTPITDVFRGIPRRGLTEDAIKKFQIDVCVDKTQDVSHKYPYTKDGVHTGNKVRKRTEKAFYWEGEAGGDLFGQSHFPPGSAKSVTVVEGEIDTASAWLMLGSMYPVVGVSGAGAAVKDCKRNFEYLDSFSDIVLCFDKDEKKVSPTGKVFYPGQEAAKKVAELFKPGKVRIMTLEHGKDPNEYLQKNIPHKTFVNEFWRAPKHTPDSLVLASEMLSQLLDPPKYFSVPYPWETVNKMTYGIRLSESYLLMADTGSGKTTAFKEIAYGILRNPDVKEKGYGVGFLHLEETNYDTALGLLSIHNNKPYHLPDVERTREEISEAHKEVLGDGRAILYDSFGSNDIDTIISKIRHMVAMGCKYIFLDHLSIIVSDQAGDERKLLDEISTKLKTLTIEQNICIFCVIHTNRSGQARGSAGPEKVANIMFHLERDKKDPDEWRRNVMKISIEKNRFCGRTGPCMWSYYNPATGRLEELDEEQIKTYEDGGSEDDSGW